MSPLWGLLIVLAHATTGLHPWLQHVVPARLEKGNAKSQGRKAAKLLNCQKALRVFTPSRLRVLKVLLGKVAMGNPTVGEAPEHWEFTTLGEVCDRGGGNIQTGPFGSQLHASDYVEEGIPSIMPVNIGDNRLIEADIKRITEEDAERLNKHRVVPGDIIYSRRGDVERRALVREEERGWLCGTGCIKVRLGEGVVDPAFASFYLDHPDVRQ